MTFENIIKKISQMLAITFMFVMADGYLFQKGLTGWTETWFWSGLLKPRFRLWRGSVVPSRFEMDEVRVPGNPAAPVTIYEFSSLGCSHCADFPI